MGFSEYTSNRTVQAEQVEETRSVITPNGTVNAEPGQWEVRHSDGNVTVVDDEAFQQEWGDGEDADSSKDSAEDS